MASAWPARAPKGRQTTVTRRGREDVVASDTCTWAAATATLRRRVPSPLRTLTARPRRFWTCGVHRCPRHQQPREDPNQRDRDTCRRQTPLPVAAAVDEHDPGRPGPPSRCSWWAVRKAAALSSSRPRRSSRCSHGLPPTPAPAPTTATRSAATLATKRSTTASTDTNAATNAATRTGRTGSGDALPSTPTSSSYPTAVRVHAVGLVGAGQPLREVARALGVHPAAQCRRVLQAWRRWAAAAGLPDSPAPSRCPDDDQE